jgi:hypothetical protein
MRVVDEFGTVDTYANKKVMLFQKSSPALIKEGSIGLEQVFNPLSWTGKLFSSSDGVGEETQPHQGWFSALPGYRNISVGMRLYDFGQKAFEHRFRHAEVRS